MSEYSDILKTRYEAVLQSDTDSRFYQNIHAYIDVIKTTPELSVIIDASERDYGTKFIDKNKPKLHDNDADYNEEISRLERFSLYASHYCILEVRIYYPIEYYKNPPEEVGDRLDPATMLMLKGFDRTLKMGIWEKKELKTLNKWYDGERKYYENELKQFHADFLTELGKIQTKILPIITKETPKISIPLDFDFRTGDFTFYKTTGTIAPATQEYKILCSLLNSESYLCAYLPLYKSLVPTATEIRKPHKETISQVVRNLKERLNILPKTESSNPDIFKNLQKVGYRLVFTDSKENTE